MSYPHYQIEQRLVAGGDLATAAVIAASRWGPGYQPVVVRALSLRVLVAGGGAGPGKVTLWRRPTPGSSSGQEEIVSLNYTSAQAVVGKVLVSANVQKKIMPGEEIVAEVVSVITAATADILALIEPSWEAIPTSGQTKV